MQSVYTTIYLMIIEKAQKHRTQYSKIYIDKNSIVRSKNCA